MGTRTSILIRIENLSLWQKERRAFLLCFCFRHFVKLVSVLTFEHPRILNFLRFLGWRFLWKYNTNTAQYLHSKALENLLLWLHQIRPRVSQFFSQFLSLLCVFLCACRESGAIHQRRQPRQPRGKRQETEQDAVPAENHIRIQCCRGTAIRLLKCLGRSWGWE